MKSIFEEIENIDIDTKGEEYTLLTSSDVLKCFKKRERNSNKGDFGYIALIGGCLEYSGAIRLAAMANASARSGAGVVTVAVPKDIAYMIAENILECTVFPFSNEEDKFESEMEYLCRRYKVIAIGMGIGQSDFSKRRVEYLIKEYKGTLIVDADALNIMSSMSVDDIKNTNAKLILTPHLKEFSRLSKASLNDIKENPIKSAKDLSKKLNTIVLLKGPTTIVTNGTSTYLVNRGCPGMATAGSGDVLSGCMAAICAFNDDLLLCAAASSYICGLAGELAEKENSSITMVASDTAKAINTIIKSMNTCDL